MITCKPYSPKFTWVIGYWHAWHGECLDPVTCVVSMTGSIRFSNPIFTTKISSRIVIQMIKSSPDMLMLYISKIQNDWFTKRVKNA